MAKKDIVPRNFVSVKTAGQQELPAALQHDPAAPDRRPRWRLFVSLLGFVWWWWVVGLVGPGICRGCGRYLLW
eukprot:8318061-Heterocapsa_arctica.AAC.1